MHMLRRSFFVVAGMVLSLLGGAGLAGSAVAQTVPADGLSIADAGATGDGQTLNTVRIQGAIDQLAGKGGGTLVVPPGVFLTGAIFLKPEVNLYLAEGGVLKGSTNVQDYPQTMTRVEGHFTEWLPALINADRADHLRIYGPGTLDGNGAPFWKKFWVQRKVEPKVTNLEVPRPRLALIQHSKDVQISRVHFKDSSFWNLHLYACQDVVVDKVSFNAPNFQPPNRAPSSDAMDVDSCQRVTVSGCTFSVGDDCVCLKGSKGPFAGQDTNSAPTEHIHVINCTFEKGQGVVTLGSEATVIRDVVVENCRVTGTIPLVRIKIRPDTQQDYEDIHYRNITLAGGGSIMECRPWTQYFDLEGQPAPKSMVKNVTVSDIKGTFGSFGEIDGKPETTISDITLENIDVQLKQPVLKVGTVDHLTYKNVVVNGKPYPGGM
jgi:alpha-L-rhamnosidase